MKITIFEFIKVYLNGRLDADTFVHAYIELYRIERDNDRLLDYADAINGFLFSVFCLVDLYNSNLKKEDYELDCYELREKINTEYIQLNTDK